MPFKVLEYPFKQNENMLIYIKMLIYSYFIIIFMMDHNELFNIEIWRSKLGQKLFIFPTLITPALSEKRARFCAAVCQKLASKVWIDQVAFDLELVKHLRHRNFSLTKFVKPWKLQDQIPFKQISWPSYHLSNFFWNLRKRCSKAAILFDKPSLNSVD